MTESDRNRRLAEKFEAVPTWSHERLQVMIEHGITHPKSKLGFWLLDFTAARGWRLNKGWTWEARDFHHDPEMTVRLQAELIKLGELILLSDGSKIEAMLSTSKYIGIPASGETIGEAVAIAAAKAWGLEE